MSWSNVRGYIGGVLVEGELEHAARKIVPELNICCKIENCNCWTMSYCCCCDYH